MQRRLIGWLIALSLVTVPAGLGAPVLANPQTVDEIDRDPLATRSLGTDIVEEVQTREAVDGLIPALEATGTPTERSTVLPADVPGAAPADLDDPLSRLWGAIETARTLQDQALGDLSPAQAEHLAQASALQAPTTDDRTQEVASDTGAATATLQPASFASEASIRDTVDEEQLRTAALALGDAAETSLPALEAPSLETRTGTCPGVSGPVAFEGPNCRIVVGGQAANTYGSAAEPALLVDLGGDDTYHNSAAGATGTVQLLVDVAGNDVYQRTDASGLLVVQGSGNLGVGVLVDAAGADTYEASSSLSAPEPGPVADDATLQAQGSGVVGAGLLADLSGEDTFDAHATTSGGDASVIAQGAAGLAGAGLIVNGPGGLGLTDDYAATATSTLHQTVDGSTSKFVKGSAGSIAHGAGSAGAGALVDLGGTDTYEATTRGAGATTLAQGAGGLGAGVLVDVTGDDTMQTRALGDTVLRLASQDPSLCWRINVDVSASDVLATGQGGADAGAGLLVDAQGTDTRTLEAESHVEAIAHATSDLQCTRSVPNRAVARTSGGSATASGHGGGTGAGALADLGLARDVNRLAATTSARAEAIAQSPGFDDETAQAVAGDASTLGQGASPLGIAASHDSAGSDTYDSSVDSTAVEITSGGTQAGTTGQLSQTLHASSGTGAAAFVDTGGEDTYTTNPPGASPASNDDCWQLGLTEYGIDTRPTTLTGCL